MIGRRQILGMIPHAGAMCLLDAVLDWDADSIRCVSQRFSAPDNPLRRADGGLGTAAGIELAAQAMAVHGRLIAGDEGPPQRGFLVGLRDVRFLAPLLDAAWGEMVVEVQRLMGDATGASYQFALSVEGAKILSGRATVLFEGAA
jgi:predicted hotdog family 3-hydroxylacyl-ACP dehydratase